MDKYVRPFQYDYIDIFNGAISELHARLAARYPGKLTVKIELLGERYWLCRFEQTDADGLVLHSESFGIERPESEAL